MEQRTDPENIDSRYNENLPANRPNLIEVAYANMRYFATRHNETWHIATHLDEPLRSEVRPYDAGFVIANNVEGMSTKGWPRSAEQASEDIELLLARGSRDTKTWIVVYANARLQNRGHDEDAVEGGIADLWTIGVPAYRVVAQYPLGKGPFHGELAGVLTERDIELLMQRSQEELFLEPATQAMTTLWIRTTEVASDGTPNAKIVMPNGVIRYFYP